MGTAYNPDNKTTHPKRISVVLFFVGMFLGGFTSATLFVSAQIASPEIKMDPLFTDGSKTLTTSTLARTATLLYGKLNFIEDLIKTTCKK